MTVFIDADSCPVVKETESLCKRYKLELIIMCDTNHIITSDYGQVITIGAGADAVDFALVNKCKPYDVVITQDYGVAAMALSKKCYCLNQNGLIFTNENIEGLLYSRYVTKKVRNSSAKHHLKGPSKRSKQDTSNFIQAFEKIINQHLKEPAND